MARYIDAESYDKILGQREKALWEIDALPVADAVSQCRKLLYKQPTINAVEIPDCKKCAYNDGLAYWHQCEGCLGAARNNFLSKEELAKKEEGHG